MSIEKLIITKEGQNVSTLTNEELVSLQIQQQELEKEQSTPKPPTAEERVLQLEQENVTNMLAMTDMYEENIKLKQENVDTMMAVTELYEMMLGGTV
ncbi:hypothetical protein [Bacillus sp. AK031]